MSRKRRGTGRHERHVLGRATPHPDLFPDMRGSRPAPIRNAEDFAAAFSVSRETVARLEVYAALLRRWQKAVNLVAPNTLDDIWQRHFADSAQLAALAPEARTWVDLGTGAGFPGLVIAVLLANQNGVMVHLVESNARKCAFLAEVARATGAPVDIHAARIESLESDSRVAAPDIVTARALTSLERLLDYAHPFFGPGTRALFLKGRSAEEEVEQARRRWSFDAELIPSRTDRDGRIVALSHVSAGGPSREEIRSGR